MKKSTICLIYTLILLIFTGQAISQGVANVQKLQAVSTFPIISKSAPTKQLVKEISLLNKYSIDNLIPNSDVTSLEILGGSSSETGFYKVGYEIKNEGDITVLYSNDKMSPPVLAIYFGEMPELENIEKLETLAKKKLLNPRLDKTYCLSFSEIWHLFIDGNDSVYVNLYPKAPILSTQEFQERRIKVKRKIEQRYSNPEIRKSIDDQWNNFKDKKPITLSNHFVPNKSDAPNYDWHGGCTPTAAADLLGYYDMRYGYSNLVKYFLKEYDHNEEEVDETVPDVLRKLHEAFGTDSEGGTSISINFGEKICKVANLQDENYNWNDYGVYYYVLWDAIKYEIDENHPALLNTMLPCDEGHSMPVYGYRDDPEAVYIYDTWHPYGYFWNKDDLDFLSVGYFHPPLSMTGNSISLTCLKEPCNCWADRSPHVINAGQYYTITWDCAQPDFGRVSIYINTESGNPDVKKWELLRNLDGNPGKYDWLVESKYKGTTNRIRIRWYDNSGKCIGEDGSCADFTISESSITSLTNGSKTIKTLPFQAQAERSSDRGLGIIAFKTDNMSNDYYLKLYATNEFKEIKAKDSLDKKRYWGMCAVRLGGDPSPPGPYGIEVEEKGSSQLDYWAAVQYLESENHGWGEAGGSTYWSSDDIVKAYHFHVDTNINTNVKNINIKLQNETSADIVMALFKPDKRWFDYGMKVTEIDNEGSGGDEEFTLDKVVEEPQGSDYYLVLWQKQSYINQISGNFKLSIESEFGRREKKLLNFSGPDTTDYSGSRRIMPKGKSQMSLVGIVPLKNSRWSLLASEKPDFSGDSVKSNLGYPFRNFVVVNNKAMKNNDSVYIKFMRNDLDGDLKIESMEITPQNPIINGQNPERIWPAGKTFQLLPIVSEIPLKDVKIMVSTNSTNRVLAGIVPDGEKIIYNPKQLIGTALKEDYPNSAKIGSIALWTLDPSDSPFSYSIDISTLTNVDENLFNNENIKVYPNPAKNLLNIEMELLQKQDVNIRLTDLLGNEIISIDCKEADHINRKIDMQSLVPGVYVLEVKFGNETVHRKVIKE